jgi:hypothetical protein
MMMGEASSIPLPSCGFNNLCSNANIQLNENLTTSKKQS